MMPTSTLAVVLLNDMFAVVTSTDITSYLRTIALYVVNRPVVTICIASLTFSNSTFCPHSLFMCFVWMWEQTAIIFLYSINWLVFITETECVFCAVRTGSLYIIAVIMLSSKHKIQHKCSTSFLCSILPAFHLPLFYRLHFPTHYVACRLALPEGRAGIAWKPSEQ